MAPMATRGPKPKGKRRQFTVSFPQDDFELYQARAAARGLPMGDYIAAICATAHGRDEPEYVQQPWPYNQPDLISA